jgi:hypothetical protein
MPLSAVLDRSREENGNWAFQLKMTFLVLAVLFALTVQREVIDAQHAAAGLRRSTAMVSLLLRHGAGLGGPRHWLCDDFRSAAHRSVGRASPKRYCQRVGRRSILGDVVWSHGLNNDGGLEGGG